MKRLIALALAMCLCGPAFGQVSPAQQPQKVSQLLPANALNGTELFPCDQTQSGILATYACSAQQLANFVGVVSAGVSSYAGRTGAIVPQLSDLTTAFGTAPGTAFSANQSAGTNKVPSLLGSFTVGHLAVFGDTAGSIQDGGAPAAGTGTITSGLTGQVAYYPAVGTSLSGNSQVTIPQAGQLQIGTPGSQGGSIVLGGATSGLVTMQTQAVAGTWSFNLPTGPGSAGQPLLSGGGGSNPQTYGVVGTTAGGTGAVTPAAARANLGVLSSATFPAGQSGPAICILNTACTWSAGQSSAPVPLSIVGGVVTPDFSQGNVFDLTLTQVITTFQNPLNMPAGQCVVVYLAQDGVGNRTITNWGGQYKFPGGTKPTLSTGANAIDELTVCTRTTSVALATFNANFQ